MRHQGGRNRGCDEKGITLSKDYLFRSNRESGFGRYDVVMEPKDPLRMAVILEFKVFDRLDEEKSLHYDTDLLSRGIPAERILKYGLAFRGKECLIRKE